MGWVVQNGEPLNSVRVTFSIPCEAVQQLRLLAEAGDAALRQLGILSIQFQGDQSVCLKLNGPNNDGNELMFRVEGPSNPDVRQPSGIARSVTNTLSASSMIESLGQSSHKPQPVPQFRSPALNNNGGPGNRSAVAQSRPPVPPGYVYSEPGTSAKHMMRHVQQQAATNFSPATRPNVLRHVVSQHQPFPMVTRPSIPSNPPPPYPSVESPLTRQSLSTPVTLPSVQQLPNSAPAPPQLVNAQIMNSPQLVSSQQNSHQKPSQLVHHQNSPQLVHTHHNPSPLVNTHQSSPQHLNNHQTSPQVVNNHQSSPQLLHAHQNSNLSNQNYRLPGSSQSAPNNVSRNMPRNHVNMVKNSPLLVGLLQQPEQSPPNAKISNISANGNSQSPSNLLTNALITPNVALSQSPTVSSMVSSNTFVGKSKDGSATTHQIFSGGSVITSSMPQVQQITSAPQPVGLGAKVNLLDPPGKCRDAKDSVCQEKDSPYSNSSGVKSPVTIKSEDSLSNASHATHGSNRKESQYLINPNTGLLEPRPTDSSDSEAERSETPINDHASNSYPSDESNLSSTSKKDTDQSDSDISRLSGSSDSRRFSDKEKSKGKESSMNATWENSFVSSNSGEKIKLRLKLGKEQVGHTTIVGNRKVDRRKETISSTEPKVPKLHIKLHSSQPVIVKSIDNLETTPPTVHELPNKDLKSKKKINRNRLKSTEVEVDAVSSKDSKLKPNNIDEVTPLLRLAGTKKSRNKLDQDDLYEPNKSKLSRLDDNKLTLSKHIKMDKARKLRKPMRKVGDLTSLGEITSHKIMETLPPSITKVADMHTQPQSRNSLSPQSIPLTSSLYSSASLPATPTNSHCTDPLNNTSDAIKIVEVKEQDEPLIEPLSSRLTARSSSLPGVMNGDICISDKVTRTNFKYSTSISSDPSAALVNSVNANSEPSQPSDTVKKETTDGLVSSVSKYLNSSILINKVSKPPFLNSVNNQRKFEEVKEQTLKKVDAVKVSCEYPGLTTNSDVTIQSVSKTEVLGLSKLAAMKPKLENKVGRVTCVDVMDRKALEEALKSSRSSTKRSDTYSKTASSMVDRLRRWNSMESSSSVPFPSYPQPQVSDSTNLFSLAKKSDLKTDLDATQPTLEEPVAIEPSCSKQSSTITSVDNKSDCDNNTSAKTQPQTNNSLSLGESNGSVNNESTTKVSHEKESLVESSGLEVVGSSSNISELHSDKTGLLKTSPSSSPQTSQHKVLDQAKLPELMAVKADVDSPDGTPKGDHGNGQGGEDSGIESMDALSEKSPNHSDQSPHRRDDKDCEQLFSDKSKEQSPKPNKEQAQMHLNSVQQGMSSEDTPPKEHFGSGPMENPSPEVLSSQDISKDLSENKDSPLPALLEDDCLTELDLIEPSLLSNTLLLPSQDIPLPEINNLDANIVLQGNFSPGMLSNTVLTEPVNVHFQNIGTPSISCPSTNISTPSNSVVQKYISPVSEEHSYERTFDTQIDSKTAFNALTPSASVAHSKPSLLAITLAKPVNSDEAPNCWSLLETQSPCNNTFELDKSENSDSTKEASTTLPSLDNDLPPSSSAVPIAAVSTTPTVLILTTTSTYTTPVSAPAKSSKVLTLKSGSTQPISSGTPVAKAFRLVALPGINSVGPSSSPVKGQIVTLKPVMAVQSSSSCVTMVQSSSESQGSVVQVKPAELALDPEVSPKQTPTEAEDLDFVGFCNTTCNSLEVEDLREKIPSDNTLKPSLLLSPSEEEPRPVRIDPPRYTYGGNKDRKKELEFETEEKEPSTQCNKPLPQPIVENTDKFKLKNEPLDTLTIEIPSGDSFADDKRLMRTTRQSARLSSPKVNSFVGELSPLEKKSSVLILARQSPVGVAKTTLSPAMRGPKRRHESESSNASSINDDPSLEPKVRRRKLTSKEESLKPRTPKPKEVNIEQCETSEDESISEDDPLRLTPHPHTDDESTKNSKISLIATKDKTADCIRRNLRQNKNALPQDINNDCATVDSKDRLNAKEVLVRPNEIKNCTLKDGNTPTKDPKVSVVCVKSKKDLPEQTEADNIASRRKTRSATNTATDEASNKRRRLSKEK